MSEILEERIRLNAPGLASGYYLEIHQKGGEVVRYPKVGAFSLKPFCAPTGTPFGTYNLFFVRYPTDRQPLPPANPAEPYPRVQIPSSRKSALDHAISQFQTGDTPVAEATAAQEVEEEEDTPLALEQMADLEVAISGDRALITAPEGLTLSDQSTQRIADASDASQFRESYVNLIPTPSGGTHESGLRAGVFEAVKTFVEHHALLPRGARPQGLCSVRAKRDACPRGLGT